MSEIDWDTFAERVPVGTKVLYMVHYEGVLLENYPWKALEDHIELEVREGRELKRKYPKNWLRFEPFDKANIAPLADCYEEYIRNLQYLINGQWRTFDEAMDGRDE